MPFPSSNWVLKVEYMKVYHGSNMPIEKPDLLHSRDKLDFGRGFYTTTNHSQAADFATRVTSVRRNGVATVSTYEIDLDAAKHLEILRFNSINGEWLDFIAAHRTGTYNGKSYDIVVGPVADDRVIRTVNLYLDGTLSRSAALIELEVNKTYDQYVFVAQSALDVLTFINAEVMSDE